MSGSLLMTPRKAFGKRQTRMHLTTQMSMPSSKRVLFPKDPEDEDSDGTLGRMSPLSISSLSSTSISSPERYDSPVVTPNVKICLEKSPKDGIINILEEYKESPKFPLNNVANQDIPLVHSPRRSPRILKQIEVASQQTTPEIVNKNPIKNSPKVKNNLKSKKDAVGTPSKIENHTVIEESPDSVSFNKTFSPTQADLLKKDVRTEPMVVEPQKSPIAQHIISEQNFYKPRVVAPLDFSSTRGRVMTFFGGVKRGRSLSTDSIHSFRSISSVAGTKQSRGSKMKRRKVGEINYGVRHRIRKPRPRKKPAKKPTKLEMQKLHHTAPTILPNARIELYLDRVGLSSPNEIKSNTKSSVVPDKKETLVKHRSPSPPIDPTKKFFITNRTIGTNRTTTVTVDKNIKLQVVNGKFKLDKPRTKPQTRAIVKKTKPQEFGEARPAFDLADPEDEVDDSIRNKVEGILVNLNTDKTLTNDQNVVPLQLDENIVSQPQLEAHDYIPTPQDLSVIATGKENKEQNLFPIFSSGQANGIPNVANKPKSKKRRLPQTGLDQYQIDAGQKKYGATQCLECFLVYDLGNPEEEITHLNYHNNTQVLKFQGWKHERVVGHYDNGRVILVNPGDSKAWVNKAKDVVQVVDKDLGYVDEGQTNASNKMVFMYISDKTVVGCLVAEPISGANRLLELEADVDVCSLETFPIKCGVNRVWSLVNHRRKGIATKLVDCMRSHFMYGHILGIDEIAFSVPTLAGKAFAAKYTNTQQFYVYG